MDTAYNKRALVNILEISALWPSSIRKAVLDMFQNLTDLPTSDCLLSLRYKYNIFSNSSLKSKVKQQFYLHKSNPVDSFCFSLENTPSLVPAGNQTDQETAEMDWILRE